MKSPTTRRGLLASLATLLAVILMAAEGREYNTGNRGQDRQSDLAVMSANEYKQKRRLERILDALDNIPDQADRAREQYNHGDIDLHARRITVQDAVNDAIWEARNLLRDHEQQCRLEAAEAVIEHLHSKDTELDTAELDPENIDIKTLRKGYQATGLWPHSPYFHGGPDTPIIGTIPQVHKDDIVVAGLFDFWQLDEYWTEEWSERVKPDNLEPRDEHRQANHTVPLQVSWAAAVRIKEFLHDQHDLEIQFEALPGGEAGFDYSDIIDAPREGFDEQ